MRKKISVSEVRIGMYVDEICGSWMDHPFWKKSFLLESENDLASLQHSSISEVWIDTALGCDVEVGSHVIFENDVAKDVENELARISASATAKIPLHEELDRTRALLAEGKTAITSMFNEVRMGNAIKISEAEPLVDEISLSIARNPEAFLNIARLKNVDDYTYLHSVAVCGLMIALGKTLGMSGRDLKDAGIAGLIHDVGKALIPNEVLNKPAN